MRNAIIVTLLVMSSVGMTYAQQSTALKPLRINFKNRGYFYASSEPLTAAAGLGGWAESGNMYRPVTDQNYSAGKLILWLKPDERRTFADKFEGFALYIINQTDDTVFFDAQDSRINMKLQAKNKKGEWSDIEYLPSSWCGNSYHHVYLPASYQWSFTAPRYKGTSKTHIRAALGYKKSLTAEEQWLYSNEIEGSVNAGQFNQMRKYKPSGIMDPYDN